MKNVIFYVLVFLGTFLFTMNASAQGTLSLNKGMCSETWLSLDGKCLSQQEAQSLQNFNYDFYVSSMQKRSKGKGLAVCGGIWYIGGPIIAVIGAAGEMPAVAALGGALWLAGEVMLPVGIVKGVRGKKGMKRAINDYNTQSKVSYESNPSLNFGFTSNGLGARFTF